MIASPIVAIMILLPQQPCPNPQGCLLAGWHSLRTLRLCGVIDRVLNGFLNHIIRDTFMDSFPDSLLHFLYDFLLGLDLGVLFAIVQFPPSQVGCLWPVYGARRRPFQ